MGTARFRARRPDFVGAVPPPTARAWRAVLRPRPDAVAIVRAWESAKHPGYWWAQTMGTNGMLVELRRPVRHDGLEWFLAGMDVEPDESTEWRRDHWHSDIPSAADDDEDDEEPAEAALGRAIEPVAPGECVYFVHAPSVARIKIGWSVNVQQRMTDLRVSSPVALHLLTTIPGGRQREMALHRRFAKSRVQGEWFDATDDLLDFIRQAGGAP